MTDYLHEVKNLVERLNLRPGDKRFQRSRARRDDKIKDKISETTISGLYGEKVNYRPKKQSFGKEFTTGSHVRKINNSVDTSDRRVSFYRLIKSNQDKCLSKNCIRGESNASPSESPRQTSALHMKENIFQFSVESTKRLNEVEAIHSSLVNKKDGSRNSSASISSSLLSPTFTMQTEPTSPKSYGTWDKKHIRKNIISDKLKSPNPDQKSPSGLDPVFSEIPTTINCRRNSGTNRPRLSESKSLPLSPAAYNAEKDALQNGNFQYKLDTLRAELVSLTYIKLCFKKHKQHNLCKCPFFFSRNFHIIYNI